MFRVVTDLWYDVWLMVCIEDQSNSIKSQKKALS